MTALRLAAALLLTFALAACDLAATFRLPGTAQPEAYKEAAPEGETGSWKLGAPAAAQPRGAWWRVFGDGQLDIYQQEALKNNQDLAAMEARVRQARETAGVVASRLLPQLDNATSLTRRQPNAVGRGLAPGTAVAIENDVAMTFTLGYELDLFGRIRNERQAAVFNAESAAETLESMRLALQADVASLYYGLQAFDLEIGILTRGVAVRERSVDILEKRLSAGSITALDLSSAVVDLENTRSQLQETIRQRQEMEHAMAVLLGRAPAAFTFGESRFLPAAPVIPPGLPSALLERRPDVVAAQRDLAAANERIGAARAAFFPSISLTGTGGFQSDTLADLFTWPSRSWSVGPSLTVPIFSGGRASANLARNKARYEEAVALYRQRVLESFRDVEDSLTRLKALAQQAESQRISENAAQQAENIANLRYEGGDLGYLETISARRDALEAERSGVRIKYARLAATIQLIRALGGGWDGAKP